MYKSLIFLSLWLCLAARVFAADSFTLADGAAFSGDIVKANDYDVMLHTTSDTYTNITWAQFSQDTLKQLSADPKYKGYATPFIEPTAADRPASAPARLNPVKRMTMPEHPSIFGGLFGSSLGLFMLLVIYIANLYAAYEVAVVRGKPVGAVMGLSAVLPIAGPVIFLMQPMKPAEEAPIEEIPPENPAAAGAGAGAGGAGAPSKGAPPAGSPDDIQIVSASWQPSQEEKKPQPQVFSRGKFTLNKRFIETKFAGFIGEPKGDAKNFTMEIKTLKETIAVDCIKQTGPTEAILETATTQVTVAYADIQEIKLIPKPA